MRLICFWAGVMVAVGGIATTPALHAGEKISTYFIGNSVTDTIQYDRFQKLVEGLGESIEIGRHTIPGAPLSWTWEHRDGGVWTPEYGPFPRALREHAWDVLSLQPFDRQLDGWEDTDDLMGANFIREALHGNPGKALRVLVYARWPRRDDENASTFYGRSYAEQWERSYENPSFDGGNETRDYFERVQAAWQAEFPELDIDLVPVGEVLSRLDQKIREGEVPGLHSIVDLYSDDIHFYDDPGQKNIGAYLVALTFFATIFERTPQGDESFPQWGIEDPKLAQVLQETVWEVVQEHVSLPENKS